MSGVERNGGGPLPLTTGRGARHPSPPRRVSATSQVALALLTTHRPPLATISKWSSTTLVPPRETSLLGHRHSPLPSHCSRKTLRASSDKGCDCWTVAWGYHTNLSIYFNEMLDTCSLLKLHHCAQCFHLVVQRRRIPCRSFVSPKLASCRTSIMLCNVSADSMHFNNN